MIALLLPILLVAAVDAPLVLAVGVNHPANVDLPPLAYADDDAAAACELFAVKPERTWLLTEMDGSSQERYPALAAKARRPTLHALSTAVQQLKGELDRAVSSGEQPTVMIWLVGHGAFDDKGRPYLALADGRLTAEALQRDVVAPLRAAHRIHLIIDSCHAEALVQSRAIPASADPGEVRRQSFSDQLSRMGNVGVVLASGASQKAYEWEEMRAGVFSALVRAGLRGGANANGDEQVTYDELMAYVAAAVQGISIPDARPEVSARPPPMDLMAPLAHRAWFARVATFAAPPGTTLHIEDEQGRWLAGGRFEPGHQPSFWLPEAAQLTMRTPEGEWALCRSEQGETLVVDATPLAPRTQARGAVERALRNGLFATSYGPSYLSGYQAARGAAPPSNAPPPIRGEPPHVLLGISLVPAALGAILLGASVATGGLAVYHAYRMVTTPYPRAAVEGRQHIAVSVLASLVAGSLGIVAAGVAALLVVGDRLMR